MNLISLKIVSPAGGCFDGEAVSVRLRTIDGDVAIMAGHVPYISAIGMGECRVDLPDGSTRYAACCGGMLSTNGAVRVVATTFEWAEDIDRERAARAMKSAQEKLAAGVTDPAKVKTLRDRLRRAQVRLQVSERRSVLNP